MTGHRSAAILLALGAAAVGCKSEGSGGVAEARPGQPPQPAGDLSAPLAQVDDVVITVKQLQDDLNRQSAYVRSRYQSKEQKRVLLDNLIRFEILAKEAARRGFDRDPEVIQTMKSAMISKLLREELSSGIKPEDVPDSEMRAAYEARRAEFDRPEEVRVSAVIVKAKRTAEQVARLAKSEQGMSNKAFRDLVGKYSVHEESKLRGGDLRYFHRSSSEVPQPVIEAAFALEKTGDVAGPIAAGGRLYVIKQTGRKKAVVRTYEQVKRQIQNELYKDKREESQKQFVQDLRGKAKVQVFENNLKKVRVDSSTRSSLEPAADGHGSAQAGGSGAVGPGPETAP
jgi:peptidyl-prolyl cis-trans isomerase C